MSNHDSRRAGENNNGAIMRDSHNWLKTEKQMNSRFKMILLYTTTTTKSYVRKESKIYLSAINNALFTRTLNNV